MSLVWNPDTEEWEKAERHGFATAKVADPELRAFMSEVLLELKKLNVYLSLLTGEEIGDEEIG